MNYFNQMLSDSGLADEAGNISFVGMLMNNWFAMVFTILYGFVPFLFLPVVTAASNALIIGALAAFYRLNQISMAAFSPLWCWRCRLGFSSAAILCAAFCAAKRRSPWWTFWRIFCARCCL